MESSPPPSAHRFAPTLADPSYLPTAGVAVPDELLGVSAAVHEAVAGVQQALLWGLDVEDCRGLALDAFLDVTASHWAALVKWATRGDGAFALGIDAHRRADRPRDASPLAEALVETLVAVATPYVRQALSTREPVRARVPADLHERLALSAGELDVAWLLVLPIPGSSAPTRAVLLANAHGFDEGLVAGLAPLLRLSGQVDTWAREVEARRRTERELERERLRLSLALSASDVGVFEFDPASGTLQWDARVWAIHGLEPPDAPWTFASWAQRLHTGDADRAIDDVLAAVEQGRALQTQYRIVRPDGEVRHVRSNAQVFDLDGARRMVGVNIDVTADVRLQQELAAERAQAEAATRAKSQFLATMSHEIRTPMNGVLGMLELLLRSGLTPAQHEHAAVAHASAESLLGILNDILDLSKLESHQVTLESIPFDVAAVVTETTALLAPRAGEKGLRLLREIDPDLPSWIAGDPMRLRQVLLNLIGNAIKFTTEGQVVVAVSRRDGDAGGSCLRIEVRDTGEGIAPEAQARLFQQFVQADSSTSRRFGGTGLGLAISRQLVELMGGHIGLHSVPGHGSTFWFEVPLVVAARHVASSPAAPSPGVPDPTPDGPLRILAVDDNPVNRRLMQAFLAPGRHHVRLADSGAEALEALRAESFDVVLMDVQMPVMDGPTCLRRMGDLGPPVSDIPVIAVTANAMAGDRERYLAEGFRDYVSKPMTMQTLAAAIARVRAARP